MEGKHMYILEYIYKYISSHPNFPQLYQNKKTLYFTSFFSHLCHILIIFYRPEIMPYVSSYCPNTCYKHIMGNFKYSTPILSERLKKEYHLRTQSPYGRRNLKLLGKNTSRSKQWIIRGKGILHIVSRSEMISWIIRSKGIRIIPLLIRAL